MHFAILVVVTNLVLVFAGEITLELKHKWDCSGVYACVFGRPVDLPECAPGWTFSLMATKCVQEGSDQADCVAQAKASPPDCDPYAESERCKLGGIMPNPTECHSFYNCSLPYVSSPYPGFYGQYRQECPYPQLFDIDTNKCQHFEYVNCGERKEYKNACDYKANQCPVSHCIPCYVRFENCEGKPDGMNVFETRIWSPYYALCYKERFITQATCPNDEEKFPQFFHPELRECVPIYMIPREHGGAMPDCSNRADGFYPDEFEKCDRYTVCSGHQFLSRGECLSGEVFDKVKNECEPKASACGPCGGNTDC